MATWKIRAACAAAAVGLVAGTTAPPALASAGDGVTRSGACSGHSTWKLKAKPDDGRLEVEGEVDSNIVGQIWRWRILHNSDVSARGTATTTGPSGSFTVHRRVVNTRGVDRIGWRAHNRATGETCRGGLSI